MPSTSASSLPVARKGPCVAKIGSIITPGLYWAVEMPVASNKTNDNFIGSDLLRVRGLEEDLAKRYNDREARIKMEGAIRDDLVKENMLVSFETPLSAFNSANDPLELFLLRLPSVRATTAVFGTAAASCASSTLPAAPSPGSCWSTTASTWTRCRSEWTSGSCPGR